MRSLTKMGRKAYVLEHCNYVRQALLSLPPLTALLLGIPGEAGACPVANTIKAGSKRPVRTFGTTEIDTPFGPITIGMPKDVFNFQQEFDRGEYPELIDPKANWASVSQVIEAAKKRAMTVGEFELIP